MSRRDAGAQDDGGGRRARWSRSRLVLCAVFVPTRISRRHLRSVFFSNSPSPSRWRPAISCFFCSLTLSPALASQILQPHEDKRPPASWNFIARAAWDKFTGYFKPRF